MGMCKKCGEVVASSDMTNKYCSACYDPTETKDKQCIEDSDSGDTMSMNEAYVAIKSEIRRCEVKIEKSKQGKTNHLLHLFLTIITMGIWVVPWILVSMGATAKEGILPILRKLDNRTEKELSELYELKDQIEYRIASKGK